MQQARFLDDISPLTRYSRPNQIAYSINISLRYKYIYSETPKAACSTIKFFLIRNEIADALIDYEDHIRYYKDGDLHDRDYSPLLSPKQLYPFMRFLNSARFFKFCFVRNPYARLLSGYLEKVVNHKAQSKQIKSALGLPRDAKINISFADFVHAVCGLPIVDQDGHWKVQYYHNCLDVIDYDFIGKVETFNKDMDFVCKRTDLNILHLKRLSPHATNASGLLAQYYTDDLKRMVYAKYEKDFQQFGYSETLPGN